MIKRTWILSIDTELNFFARSQKISYTNLIKTISITWDNTLMTFAIFLISNQKEVTRQLHSK